MLLLLCRAFSANPKPLNPKPCCVFRVQTFLGVVQEAVSKHLRQRRVQGCQSERCKPFSLKVHVPKYGSFEGTIRDPVRDL